MSRITTLATFATALLLLAASPALAQEALIPYGLGDDNMQAVPSNIGITASAGGGIENFVEGTPREFTNLAGAWNVRVGILSRFLISPELAYIGSAQDLDAAGLSNNAYLLSNGGEANLRLNILPGMIQPYVFGGIGFRHYSIEGTDTNLSAIADNDTIGIVPVGGGLTLRIDQFLLDARGTFRFAFNDTMMAGAGTDDLGMATWSTELRAGIEI
jgi:hypothetical protein